MLLAFAATKEEQFELAEKHCSIAINLSEALPEKIGDGPIYELRSEFFWKRDDHTNALHWAENSKLEYLRFGYFENAKVLDGRIGMLLVTLGRYEEASKLARVFDATAQGTKTQFLRGYAKLLMYFLNKCDPSPEGIERPKITKSEVEVLVDDDKKLSGMLQYVEDFQGPKKAKVVPH